MLCFLILAAGQSKRMKSSVPKIWFPLLGKSLIDHLLEQIPVIQKDIFIVSNTPHGLYQCIPQSTPAGTGHAVMEALKHIPACYTEVVILCGDTPLVTKKTLEEVMHAREDLVLVGFKHYDFTKTYGRLMNEGERIVEYREATEEEKNKPEMYAGVMRIKRRILEETLPQLKPHPEFYLTEILEKTEVQRRTLWKTEEEFLGVNTKEELAIVERVMQRRLMKKLMSNGAIFFNPDTSSVYPDTVIEADAIIHPNVFIGKNVTIHAGAVIYPFTYLENCVIQKGAEVGPFVHLRGGTLVGEKAIIGNFVEVKNTVVGEKSKVKHLSYLGDATLGQEVNVGAGTITCNYDGFEKKKTVIEDGVFIGSNSTLIAPVTIHEKAYVGAGSAISDDVEAYDLVFTRAERKDKKNWVKKKMQTVLS